MARIRIPCLVARTNKAGLTSWYWQPSKTLATAGWKPQPLGKDEGAAIAQARALNDKVEQWKRGGPKPELVERRRDPGTLAAGIARYRREVIRGTRPNGKPILRPKTVAVYETSLARLEQWGGKHPLAYFTPARVRALRDATARPVQQGGLGHAAAFNLLKMGRQLFAWFITVDLIPRGSNPFEQFGLAKPPPRASVWAPADDKAFDAAAYALGFPGMVLARELALYTAQRESDLIAFNEGELVPLKILNPQVRETFERPGKGVTGWQLNQRKTSTEYRGNRLSIPLEPAIADKVEAALRTNRARDRQANPPRLLSHVLTDERPGPRQGMPWQQRAFAETFRRILDHAADNTGRPHMKELTWHDLRRTRVVRLLEMGFEALEISSITGIDPKTILELIKTYGPINPTITAAALAQAIASEAELTAAAEKEASGRNKA